jgi:4-hydroxybenzoate polyprenyltransferase
MGAGSAAGPGAGPPPAGREGQTFRGASRLVHYVNLVKLPHTLFALPFALVGATLASYVHAVTARVLAWIVVAFTSARFAAMGFNRIVDRQIDARNPRTRMRELPSGALTVLEASVAVAVASGLFVLSAAALNRLCLVLSPLALAWVLFYSFTKRFTRWSHLVLGVGLSIAPVGGYLAVVGRWSHPWWMLVALALAVTTWSGGFDVLYALQDVEFDRAHRLHSLPAVHGERGALAIARVLHVLTVVCLVLVGVAVGGGWLYWTGVVVAAALLLYEHSLVRVDDLSRLDAAFFTMNGIISIAFFAFVLAERVLAAGRPFLSPGAR